ncbi:MAG: hypothetical protein OEU92_31785 [Alphaproteobacteria bacterium]|nr:hypothetical protein [Alphaproteobacteria bacterium]
MTGSFRLIEQRRNAMPLGWRSRWKLEASFWAGIAVIAWEITPLRSLLLAEIAPFAEWIALGLAGVATLTAMQVKRRLRQRLAAEEMARVLKAPNPLSLIDLLRGHAVRELGAVYLYMPIPKRARHDAAWAWIETLQAEGLIKGEPWHIKAGHVKETVRQSHAHLFADNTAHFDVYRLHWEALSEIMGDELI